MKEFRIPHLDKAVGIPTRYPESQKILEDRLIKKRQEAGEDFKPYELEKTEKDKEIIEFVENALDRYLEKYGRQKKVEIPLENIHILKKGETEKLTGGEAKIGAYSTEYGDVLIDKLEKNINFSLILFHELLHAKSFAAMQVTEGKTKEERRLRPYRAGFSASTRNGKIVYFESVNEAIVGLLTKRFFEEYAQNDPLFVEELKEMKEKNISIDLSRTREIEIGLQYIKKIYELRKDEYSEKEIEDMFIEAGINGNLLKVARLIEGTFGKGSFRKLGEKTSRLL
jgi:hypothetical protein